MAKALARKCEVATLEISCSIAPEICSLRPSPAQVGCAPPAATHGGRSPKRYCERPQAACGVVGALDQIFGAFEQIFGSNQQVSHVGGSDQEAKGADNGDVKNEI